MIKNNLYLSKDAMPKLMEGVRKSAEAVAMTLGTSGKNSLIECIESPGSYPSNDGFTIINSIHFEDPLEDMGRRKLCEAINRANKASGDGSSTTCVLTAAILEEGMKHLEEASPMEIKKSLEDCIPLIEKSIKEQTKEITVDTVKDVATIAAEDEKIGGMIQEIYQKIGKTGVIQWDVSKTSEDSYKIENGITVHGAKYASRDMCDVTTQGLTNEVKIDNPLILLLRKKISSIMDINNISQYLFETKGMNEFVVFCDDIDPIVCNLLGRSRQILNKRVVVIKMPVIWADEWWEDLELATGARIIDAKSGIRMQDINEYHMGTCEHLTVNRNDTIIEGIKDINTHILLLKGDGTDEALQRAERLNTKTARYFVGAHSESALAYRRLKVEDSINAASCALENGVVAGGGVAFLNSKKAVDHTITAGARILQVVLEKPFDTIMKNAGIKNGDVNLDGKMGYNSKTGEKVNMFDAGIVDASDVVLNAIKNAIGVAASILTIGSVVLLPREDQPQLQIQMPVQR